MSKGKDPPMTWPERVRELLAGLDDIPPHEMRANSRELLAGLDKLEAKLDRL